MTAVVTAGGIAVLEPADADNRSTTQGHWEINASVATMTFVDYTGSLWPIGTAHADWDQAYNIDVDWTTNDIKCNHCVPVHTVEPKDDPRNSLDAGCDASYGYFLYTYDADDHFADLHLIRLNRDCNSRSAAFRRALACQEMGHALGLDHADVTGSCMFADSQYAASTPREHDYFMLNQVIYNPSDH